MRQKPYGNSVAFWCNEHGEHVLHSSQLLLEVLLGSSPGWRLQQFLSGCTLTQMFFLLKRDRKARKMTYWNTTTIFFLVMYNLLYVMSNSEHCWLVYMPEIWIMVHHELILFKELFGQTIWSWASIVRLNPGWEKLQACLDRCYCWGVAR